MGANCKSVFHNVLCGAQVVMGAYERDTGVEPVSSAWKADVEPIN